MCVPHGLRSTNWVRSCMWHRLDLGQSRELYVRRPNARVFNMLNTPRQRLCSDDELLPSQTSPFPDTRFLFSVSVASSLRSMNLPASFIRVPVWLR